jgi:hypothetical protein
MSDTRIAVISLGTLDHPAYSPNLALLDYHLSELLKQQLGGCWFQNKEEVEMAVHEWLQKQEPDFHHDRIFKFPPRWNKCNNVARDYAEN